MGKSSIHIQKASNGAITHNSRENYSKSVVFIDEKNELWNDKKIAYEIYRPPLHKGTKCDMRFKSSLNSARLNLLNPYK